MKSVAFRVDASTAIGTGHVVRCLTLANELRKLGAACCFIGRELHGNLINVIQQNEFEVVAFPSVDKPEQFPISTNDNSSLSNWDWEFDAKQTLDLLPGRNFDWLVVDHYGLDSRWETSVLSICQNLLVIDDLMDRPHCCNFILDQSLRRNKAGYKRLVPDGCIILVGSEYALLRPDFAVLKNKTPTREDLRRILLFFGGSDPTDETTKALKGVLLAQGDWAVDVVVGVTNPHIDKLKELIAQHANNLELHVQTTRMAQLMAMADLAIGAAGTASWERCCLGLPAIITILADNQVTNADDLERFGAAINLGEAANLLPSDYAMALKALEKSKLRQMSENASKLADGYGACRVAEIMREGKVQKS